MSRAHGEASRHEEQLTRSGTVVTSRSASVRLLEWLAARMLRGGPTMGESRWESGEGGERVTDHGTPSCGMLSLPSTTTFE